MASPVILVHHSGSDSVASGAGPATALTGSNASTDATGLIVTLDGSPDLSGVDDTNDTHVLYLNHSSGRNFGRITGKDDTAKTVTVDAAFAASLTGKSWAIGGKRASIGSASSWKLLDNGAAAGDAMPGWTIQLESGHAETIGATAGPSSDGRLIFRRAGTTADGPITLRGASGAATKPVLTFAANAIGVMLFLDHQHLRDLELRNSASPTASIAVDMRGIGCVAAGLTIADPTDNFWKGIASPTNGFQGATIRLCEIAFTASHGIESVVATTGFRIAENYIHDCGGSGILVSADCSGLSIRGNVIADCTGDQIGLSGFTSSTGRQFAIEGNTLHSGSADGIEINLANASLAGCRIVNNILSGHTGAALKFSHASATDALLSAYGVFVSHNDTFGNGSAYVSATGTYAYNACPWAFSDPGANPTYSNAAAGDYTPTNAALKAGYQRP